VQITGGDDEMTDSKRCCGLPPAGEGLVTLNKDYRITLPRSVRERLGIKPGDKIMVEVEGRGFKLTPVKPRVDGRS
jgi:AbrB family looped-hinge helix DNA binding protein